MKTFRTIAVASLLALTLASCSSTPPQEATPSVSVPPAATQSPTPTATPTATRKANERGQIIKEVGEPASRTNVQNAPPTLTFKVTSIKPIECDAPYATPPMGTIIAIALEVATTSDFSGPLTVNGQEGQISFGAHYWKGYAANGTRMNTVESPSVQNCLADRSQVLPDYIGRGEHLNGLVLLDVTSPSGEVAFDPTGSGGWVWKYPSA